MGFQTYIFCSKVPSKCRKCRFRDPKFQKISGGHAPVPRQNCVITKILATPLIIGIVRICREDNSDNYVESNSRLRQKGKKAYLGKLRQKGLFGQFSVKFNFDMIFKQNCVKQKIHLGENYTDPPPLFKNSPYAHEITPSISQNSITLFTPVDNLQQVVRLYTSMQGQRFNTSVRIESILIPSRTDDDINY